ncbi:MAG: hypothetical protein ACOYOS_24360, partial [Syntrophales bacterium]
IIHQTICPDFLHRKKPEYFCFRTVRKLVILMANLRRRLGMFRPAISKSVARDKQIADLKGF